MKGIFRVIAVLVLVGAGLPCQSAIKYVSPNGCNLCDGASWENAKYSISAALSIAKAGDEIWVETGTFKGPFNLKEGVALYGGFEGYELVREARNPTLFPTILDGGSKGTTVNFPQNAINSTRLDGFVIQNGAGSCGGIYCNGGSPVIVNNRIINNKASGNGGGISCNGGSPRIYYNWIEGNSAVGNGGGIVLLASNAEVFNNMIYRNTSEYAGGGIRCDGNTTPLIANNTIVANSAVFGGGISGYLGTPSVINNSIIDNHASSDGGAFCGYNSAPTLANNIIAFNQSGVFDMTSSGKFVLRNNCFYSNNSYHYKLCNPGSTDLRDRDPLLVNMNEMDFHLRNGSPCCDTGNDSMVGSSWFDLDGNARKFGLHVDIGADEWASPVGNLTFTPEGNSFDAPLVVNISCPTSGAVIHYTLNGNDPTEQDAIYTDPLYFEESALLKARAFAVDHNPSDVKSAFYYIRGGVMPRTFRVSVSSDGIEGNADSHGATALSSDGRYVLFASKASNLVPNDTNGNCDVFVYDRKTWQTERVSLASNGSQINGNNTGFAMSADGRYVAFISDANGIVPEDNNSMMDVFVRDRVSNTTERVSVSSDNLGGNKSSGAYGGAISADGRYVAFISSATNLVPNDTNGFRDVFVHDRIAHTTEIVSVSTSGQLGNAECYDYGISMSADGRYVGFVSLASNLVAGDNNSKQDVFVRDRTLHTTECVSVSSSGSIGNEMSGHSSISDDGRYVVFASSSSNLVANDTNDNWDVFVRDREAQATERISVGWDQSQGNGWSGFYLLAISGDGQYIAYDSEASNLVYDDTNNAWDVFVCDWRYQMTERISLSSRDEQGNGPSGGNSLAISRDGQYLSFSSSASNLVPYDFNKSTDVFVRERVGSNRYVSSGVGFIQKGWNLISLPVDPVNADPLSVFSNLNLSMSSLQYWKNEDGGGFQGYGSTTGWSGPLQRGTAYWLLATSQDIDKEISYYGIEPCCDFELTIPAHQSAPFWIMFGTPFDSYIPTDSICFKNAAVTGSSCRGWIESYELGLVESKALKFDSRTQRFLTVGSMEVNPDEYWLEPWCGYWLLVRRPEELIIGFPK